MKEIDKPVAHGDETKDTTPNDSEDQTNFEEY